MPGTLRIIASLPRHLVDGMQAAVETTHQLPSIQRVVTARLSSLDQGLRDLLALLPAVASDLERVRATVEPQHQRVAAIEAAIVVLPAIAADLERVRANVEPQHQRVAAIERTVTDLNRRLRELDATLKFLETDVEDATEHLPDPPTPGPFARARETLVGRS